MNDKAIARALLTWYSEDNPLHYNPHHPLGKLLGEWGELLDDYMKTCYKPDFESNFMDELGDIWYYLRILCYQRGWQPHTLKFDTFPRVEDYDYLITLAIREVANSFLSLARYQTYSTFCLDMSYTVLSESLKRRSATLDELTEWNWQKLKPGSKRGEQWMKARGEK